ERIHAELIADGRHVHPAAIRLLLLSKPEDKIILITDAVSAAGLGDGSYRLGGLKIAVQDGIARLQDGGNLAGSTLTMIQAFRYMVQVIGCSIEDASRFASRNPAKQLGMDNDIGSIAVGKRADLVLLTPELNVQQVWIDGKPVV